MAYPYRSPAEALSAILACLSNLEDHPDEEIVPYREFKVEGKLYYFTPGGVAEASSH